MPRAPRPGLAAPAAPLDPTELATATAPAAGADDQTETPRPDADAGTDVPAPGDATDTDAGAKADGPTIVDLLSPPRPVTASTAPLEPPAPDAPEAKPVIPTQASAGTAATLRRQGERILDSATGEKPDTEGLFEKVTPIGNVVRSTKRLLRETTFGHHGHPTTVLLVAQGSEIEASVSEQILAAIAAQD